VKPQLVCGQRVRLRKDKVGNRLHQLLIATAGGGTSDKAHAR
jgi:hypothetical protein